MKIKQNNYSIIFLIIYTLISLLILAFSIGGDTLDNISGYITNTLVLVFSALILITRKVNNAMKKSIIFIFLGMLLWIIGNIIWEFSGYDVVSIADVSYYIGYLGLAIGFVYGILSIDPNAFKSKKNKLLCIGGTILFSILFFSSFWNFNESTSTNLATSGYVLADLVLLTILIVMIHVSVSKNTFWASMCLFIGTLFITLADVIYALNYELNERDLIVSIIFLFAYVLYCLSFTLTRNHLKKR